MAAVALPNGSATPNGNGAVVEPQPPAASTTIDTHVLIDHLTRLLQVVLGATDDHLRRSGSFLNTKRLSETIRLCEAFANEPQSAGLYIQQLRLNNDENDDLDSGDGNIIKTLLDLH
jgi:dynein heavy chain 1